MVFVVDVVVCCVGISSDIVFRILWIVFRFLWILVRGVFDWLGVFYCNYLVLLLGWVWLGRYKFE